MRAELEDKVDICTETAVATLLTDGGAQLRRRGRAASGASHPMGKPYEAAEQAIHADRPAEDLGRVTGVTTAGGATYESSV